MMGTRDAALEKFRAAESRVYTQRKALTAAEASREPSLEKIRRELVKVSQVFPFPNDFFRS